MHHHDESLFAACVRAASARAADRITPLARVWHKKGAGAAPAEDTKFTHADVRDETLVLLRRRAQYRFRCCMSRRIALF